jgi:uncharacterized YigZ family protein
MLELVESTPFLLVEKKSRFLAELLPATSPEEVKALLASQREKYADATHVAHAMVLGENAEILGCSDDGEPSGTAGRPVLEVLKGSGISQVLLTVTRWFGGTKLGTGGLVHAYGDAAKGVLSSAVTRPRIATSSRAVLLPYPLLEQGRRLLRENRFEVRKEDFLAEGVRLSGVLPDETLPALETALRDLSRGKISLMEE